MQNFLLMEEITNSFYKFGAQVDFDSLSSENLKNSASNCFNNFYNYYFYNSTSNNIIIAAKTKTTNPKTFSLKKKRTKKNFTIDDDDNNSNSDSSYIDKKKIWTFVEQNLDLDLLYKKNNMDFYTDISFLVTKNDINYLDHIIE